MSLLIFWEKAKAWNYYVHDTGAGFYMLWKLDDDQIVFIGPFYALLVQSVINLFLLAIVGWRASFGSMYPII